MPALPAHAAGDDVEFVGSGWGHGVGMSQYGAYGMALNGYSTPQILGHYYQGTSVVDISQTSAPSFLGGSQPLWIGLLQDRTEVSFRFSGGGGTFVQDGDTLIVAPVSGETWKFHVNGQGQCQFRRVVPASPAKAGNPRPCNATLTPASNATVTMLDEGFDYSSGTFRFRAVPSNPQTFHTVLQLGLDPYLGGIAEMPTWWHAAALRAQVIAARSYLVANTAAKGPEGGFSSLTKENCWCHLYDDTRSQVYKGDILLGNSNWQTAISSTSGQVVSYGGTVISAFYSSSSGGKTENVEDVWGGSPRPYLVSVDDHWAHIGAVDNPRSNWTATRSAGSIAAKVGLDELLSVNTTHRSSGAADDVTFVGKKNGAVTSVVRTGNWVRWALGLYSQYFDVDWDGPVAINSAYDITWDNHSPIGWIDGVSDTGNGSLRVRGWTLDFDTELPLIVHVYVDGKFAKGLWADDRRPDVANAHHNGDRHGFDVNVGTADGSHTVCVYALNAPTKKGNPRIGCRTVSVSSPDEGGSAPPPPDASGSQPFGWIDGISVSGGNLKSRGWAIDRDAADKAVPIHIYVDGAFFQGGPADGYRPDVNRVHDLGTHHGFEFSKPIAGGSHRVCIYAINLPERSNNPLLGCKNVTG